MNLILNKLKFFFLMMSNKSLEKNLRKKTQMPEKKMEKKESKYSCKRAN